MYCSNCGFPVDSQPVCPRCGVGPNNPAAALPVTLEEKAAPAMKLEAEATSATLLEATGELDDEFEYIPEIDWSYPSLDMFLGDWLDEFLYTTPMMFHEGKSYWGDYKPGDGPYTVH